MKIGNLTPNWENKTRVISKKIGKIKEELEKQSKE